MIKWLYRAGALGWATVGFAQTYEVWVTIGWLNGFNVGCAFAVAALFGLSMAAEAARDESEARSGGEAP